MANLPRPTEVRNGKRDASKLLTSLLLDRSTTAGSRGSKAEELQEIYRVGDGSNTSPVGSYWLKLVRGTRSLGDRAMARVAHEAILRGELTPRDYLSLQLVHGGPRILQAVGDLLLDLRAGFELSKHLVDTHYARWEANFSRANVRREQERQALRSALKAARKKVGLATTALSALQSQLSRSEFFEIPYRPAEPPGGTWDDGPYVSSTHKFQNLLSTAENALADATPALTQVAIREKYFCGFADISRLEPQNPIAAESLEELLEPHLLQLEQAWAVDDDAAEIVLEHATVSSEILPAGSVVRICWTRPLDESRLAT